MIDSNFFYHIINVIKKRIYIAFATKKLRNTTNTSITARICKRFQYFIWLAANMMMQSCRRCMACNHGLSTYLCSFEAGLPARVCNINQYPLPVHFSNCLPAKIAQSTICSFSTTIAQHVTTLVSNMHHADAKLKKNTNGAQLFLDRNPILRQRHTISC